MKTARILTFTLALSASAGVIAQSDGMKGMHGMDMKGCADMKGMDMSKCHDMMKGSEKTSKENSANPVTHQATGTVKKINAETGKVTLAHGPVKSLSWPSMTMSFVVSDKSLLDKLAVGKKVDFEFVQKGPDYVVTAVK